MSNFIPGSAAGAGKVPGDAVTPVREVSVEPSPAGAKISLLVR
jgi:hypothetical protein